MDISEIRVGDIIRTKTGKRDRVVTSVNFANTPEEIAERQATGRSYVRRDHVSSIGIQDGKLFGASTTTLPENVTLVKRKGE